MTSLLQGYILKVPKNIEWVAPMFRGYSFLLTSYGHRLGVEGLHSQFTLDPDIKLCLKKQNTLEKWKYDTLLYSIVVIWLVD